RNGIAIAGTVGDGAPRDLSRYDALARIGQLETVAAAGTREILHRGVGRHNIARREGRHPFGYRYGNVDRGGLRGTGRATHRQHGPRRVEGPREGRPPIGYEI